MPDDKLPPLSAVQLQIMNVVWDREQVTVSDVWQELQSDRAISRGAVQTMILRLEEKGWLTHREVGQAFLYSATQSRDLAQRQIVSDVVDSAFAGSPEGLVWSLLDSRGISAKEAERMHELIDKAANKRRKRKAKK